MIKNKTVYCLTCIVLVVSMFSSLVLPVSAHITQEITPLDSWWPPEDFVDPVTLKIQEFRAEGLSDEEITVQLEVLGMGWYPKTGATWLGKALSPEEAAKMPITNPASNSSNENVSMQQNTATRGPTKSTSLMRTTGSSYTGVSAEIVCGSMAVSSGETSTNYLCVQMGDLSGGTDWAEIVVTHNLGETYKWYVFDPDEGGWIFCGNKNTGASTADNYVILLNGKKDSFGWGYDVWINYKWQSSGHVGSQYVKVGYQKEVYSATGQFTSDTSYAVFNPTWVNSGSGWYTWTSGTSATWSAQSPIQYSYTTTTSSGYKWETWV